MFTVSVGHELNKGTVKTVYLCIKCSLLTGVVHDGSLDTRPVGLSADKLSGFSCGGPAGHRPAVEITLL